MNTQPEVIDLTLAKNDCKNGFCALVSLYRQNNMWAASFMIPKYKYFDNYIAEHLQDTVDDIINHATLKGLENQLSKILVLDPYTGTPFSADAFIVLGASLMCKMTPQDEAAMRKGLVKMTQYSINAYG